MTISTTTSTVTYLGNGSATSFTFPFVGVSAGDISVTYTNTLGVETVLSPSEYTLVLNAPAAGQLWGIGGTVTYPNSGSPPVPIAVGTYLAITRTLPLTQTTSVSNQGAFYPTVIETALDYLTMLVQQQATDSSYALRAPLSDPEPPNTIPSFLARANLYLAFDSDGNPIATAPASGTSPPSVALPRRVSTTGTATIAVLATDSFAGVSIYQSSTPATTIQLPAGSGPFPIFDGSLNAGSYPITVLPPPGLLILGQTSFSLNFNGQSATFAQDGFQVLVS